MEKRGKGMGGNRPYKRNGADVRTASDSRESGANHHAVLSLADGLAPYPIRKSVVRDRRRT